MEIPVYKEIKLTGRSMEEIPVILDKLEISTRPIIIGIDHLEEEKQTQVLDHITQFIDTHNINPQLPYPLYILSTLTSTHDDLMIIKDKENLPKFFYQKEKRPHVKETVLIEKIELKRNRINRINLDDKFNRIMEYADIHRKLNTKCYEGDYLEKLYKKIKKD